MENQVRELLQDVAEDIPPQRQVPPALRGRARRRIMAVGATTLAVTAVLVAGGVGVVRSMSQPPVPIQPVPTPTPSAGASPTAGPPPLGAGEVLTVWGKDLVAKDPNGGEMRTIVNANALPGGCRHGCSFGSSEDITGAAWSPDRRWVAFRAGGLWVADTTGGAPRQLIGDLGWNPWAWSPTEDQIAVVQGREMILIDAATGRKTDLGTAVGPKDLDGYAVRSLVWSPDGTRIAYDGGPVAGPDGVDPGFYDGGGSVYSIDVESGEQTLLVPQPAGTGEIKDIDWSPDGAHLAISYVDASYIESHNAELHLVNEAKALYLANADGSDVRLVDRIFASQWPVWMPGLSVGTAWSPDGIRLAYTNFAGPHHQELQVWTASVEGSAPSLVTSQCCAADAVQPAWSPDGSQIAFATTSVPLDRLVVNADGTGDPREIDERVYFSWGGGWYFCACYW